MRLVGICGSLRKESYNLKLLKVFGELLPPEASFEIAFLHDIPLFSEDQEAIAIPSSVHKLADKINVADAVVFGCPEYNYSITGVLKNAIDWVSRHPTKPFAEKTAAVIGASMGKMGSARAQYHLRQVAVFVDLRFINRPEVMVGEAHKKFSDEGKLNDTVAINLLKQLIETLYELYPSKPLKRV
jgi:chromate reductase